MFLLQWLSVSLYTNKDGVEGASLYPDQAGAQGIDDSDVFRIVALRRRVLPFRQASLKGVKLNL